MSSPAATRSQVLGLYRSLLHHSSKFAAYNFRDYAVRRTRDAFHAAKNETDPAKIEALITKGKEQLEVVRRQSLISQLYGGEKLIVENPKNQKILRKH
ncbi:LYR motif-containing protein 4 [Lunasporangiospora selenospora]|uniref:LYR motif-containing protein 4 n=1 Tax=Lunasporangiospora selenospora TaxID=979761 RepID=A0A9P6FXT7_9FUNG|nr:LYR motif-containing protein 4 [Lunasporangiospora selenospora]